MAALHVSIPTCYSLPQMTHVQCRACLYKPVQASNSHVHAGQPSSSSGTCNATVSLHTDLDDRESLTSCLHACMHPCMRFVWCLLIAG